MKNLKAKITLTHRILFLSLATLLITSLVNGIQIKFMINSIKDSQNGNFESYSRLVSGAIATQFQSLVFEARHLAGDAVFSRGASEDIVRTLNKYAAESPYFDLLIYTDTQGKVVATNKEFPGDKKPDLNKIYEFNLGNAKWFKDVVAENFLKDDNEQSLGLVFEDLHVDPLRTTIWGAKKYGTSFSLPIKDEQGHLQGVLSVRTNFRWVEDEAARFYLEAQKLGMSDTEITVANKEGFIIADYYPAINNGSLDVAQDPEVILKNNLVTNGNHATVEALKGLSGASIDLQKRTNTYKINGYSPVTAKKFPSSIGWVVLIRLPVEEAFAVARAEETRFFLVLLVITLFSVAGAYLYARYLGKKLLGVSENMKGSVAEAADIAEEISIASANLAASSQEQAAAIQESVSALSEMSSMIAQTGENVNHSLETAREAQDMATEGQQTMSRMSQAMSSIQVANNQLQDISRVIADIGAKTDVINDIVFKTQLLSFNASIEAARAGQHGRGFAVVAEEVGSLAEMSGKAARDISGLLEESQRKVQDTLGLIHSRVGEGHKVSEEALRSFNEINQRISDINNQIKSISEATEQQEVGIQQTNAAMKQMDVTAQNFSSAAGVANETSNKVRQNASNLNLSMGVLRQLVAGSVEPTSKTLESDAVKSEGPVSQESDHGDLETLAFDLIQKHRSEQSPVAIEKIDEKNFKRAI